MKANYSRAMLQLTLVKFGLRIAALIAACVCFVSVVRADDPPPTPDGVLLTINGASASDPAPTVSHGAKLTIRGWATDSQDSCPLRVEIYIDSAFVGYASSCNDPTYGPQAGWTYDYYIPAGMNDWAHSVNAKAYNSQGGEQDLSGPWQFWVNDAPVIVIGPASQTITLGQPVTFGLSDSGLNAYQWKFNGNVISGATTKSYTIASTTLANAGSYTVTLTNNLGQVTSSPAVLTISNLAITVQPQSFQLVAPGATAVLSVTATATAYQWWFLGNPLPGATNSTLSIPNMDVTKTGGYYVAVSDSSGSMNSGVASIALGTVYLSSYAFGQNSPPTVRLTSSVPGSYSYYKLRVKIGGVPGYPDGFHAVTAINNDGETLETVPAPGTYPVALYWLRYDGAGNLLEIGPQSLQNITITAPTAPPAAPTGLGATSIDTASFTATWTPGGGAAGYQIDVSPNVNFTSFVAGYQSRDVGNSTAVPVTGLSTGTTYYFRVRGYNSLGAGANSAAYTVTTIAAVNGNGSGLRGDYYDGNDFNLGWWEKTDYGEAVNFNWGSSQPSGLEADFSIIWKGRVQARTTGYYTFSTSSSGGVRLTLDGTQIISNLGFHSLTENYASPVYLEAGVFYPIQLEYCRLSGLDGIIKLWWQVGGGSREIVPAAQLYQPAPIQQPTVWSQNASIPVGQPWTPSYFGGAGGGAWQFHVNNNGWTAAPWTPTAAGSYTFYVLRRGDAIYDQMGSWPYTVTVTTPPPLITTQPQNLTISVGQSATLSVVATGTSLTYQWRKDGTNLSNGANLSGATGSTLTLTNCQTTASGAYSVVIANAGGSVTSAAASLTVSTGPTGADAPAAPTNLHVVSVSGTTVSLAWNASAGTPAAAGYVIYRGGNQIGTADSATLTYLDGGLYINTTASYTVKALGRQGGLSGVSNAVVATTTNVNAQTDSTNPGSLNVHIPLIPLNR
jgi:beta-galactosidase